MPPMDEDAEKALVQSQWISQHGAAPGQPGTSTTGAAPSPQRSVRLPVRADESQVPQQVAGLPLIAGTGEMSRFALLRERVRARLLLGSGPSSIREVSPPICHLAETCPPLYPNQIWDTPAFGNTGRNRTS